MFDNSPVTKLILRYGSTILGQFTSPLVLSKVYAIHSAESPYPRCPVIHSARSREFKSITSELAMSMFHKDLYIDVAGDTTIHGLKNEIGVDSEGNVDLDGKCLLIDEANLLYNAMHKRSQQRVVSGISTLYTREKYEVSTEQQRFVLTGRISFVINISAQAFQRHKEEIFETNLGDRSLILHGWMNTEERFACQKRLKENMRLKSGVFIKERYNKPIKNLDEYDGELKTYAVDYGTLGERAPAECLDIVTAIASENARLNQRDYLTKDDIVVVRMLRPYNAFPLSAKLGIKILILLREGKRPIDICHLLRQEPEKLLPKISYYRKKYLLRGALDLGET